MRLMVTKGRPLRHGNAIKEEEVVGAFQPGAVSVDSRETEKTALEKQGNYHGMRSRSVALVEKWKEEVFIMK